MLTIKSQDHNLPPGITPRDHSLGRPLNRDRLVMVPRLQAATAALLALDGVQNEDPEVQVLGAAVLFATLCSRLNLDAHEVYLMARKVLDEERDPFNRTTNNALTVMRSYAGRRLMGQTDTWS